MSYTWDPITPDKAGGEILETRYGAGVYIQNAGSYGDGFLVSSDCISWTFVVPTVTSGYWYQIVWTGTYFFASRYVGTGEEMWRSADGLSWTRVQISGAGSGWSYNPLGSANGYAYVRRVKTSPSIVSEMVRTLDGVTFEALTGLGTNPDFAVGAIGLNGGVYAVGYGDDTYSEFYSADGVSFTRTELVNDYVIQLLAAPERNQIFRSMHRSPPPTYNTVYSAEYSSDDGATWHLVGGLEFVYEIRMALSGQHVIFYFTAGG